MNKPPAICFKDLIMEKFDELKEKYLQLIKARQSLNTEIKKVRNQLRGQYAKERFKILAELLDFDPSIFDEED